MSSLGLRRHKTGHVFSLVHTRVSYKETYAEYRRLTYILICD